MNLPPTLRKLARRGVTFSRALLKDGNLLSRPQPEAVLAPVSYRSSRRRRRRKRLLLKVPIEHAGSLESTKEAAESKSNLLSALQTSQVLDISTYTPLKHGLILLFYNIVKAINAEVNFIF